MEMRVQGVDEVYATHLMLSTDQPFFDASRKGDLYTARPAQKVRACGAVLSRLPWHHPCVRPAVHRLSCATVRVHLQ
jgi:hypothetical protein